MCGSRRCSDAVTSATTPSLYLTEFQLVNDGSSRYIKQNIKHIFKVLIFTILIPMSKAAKRSKGALSPFVVHEDFFPVHHLMTPIELLMRNLFVVSFQKTTSSLKTGRYTYFLATWNSLKILSVLLDMRIVNLKKNHVFWVSRQVDIWVREFYCLVFFNAPLLHGISHLFCVPVQYSDSKVLSVFLVPLYCYHQTKLGNMTRMRDYELYWLKVSSWSVLRVFSKYIPSLIHIDPAVAAQHLSWD